MDSREAIEKQSNRQIKMGAVMSYVTVAVNIITGLIYTPWMVDKIGNSQYGIYSLVVTLIGFFTMDFGMSEAIARFLSKFHAEGNKQKEKDFMGITIKIYGILDVIIFLVLLVVFCLSGWIYRGLTVSELTQFRVVYLISMGYAILSFPFLPLNGILISNEKFAFYRFQELFNRVVTVITMMAVLFIGGRLYSLVIVNAVVGLLTIALKGSYIWKKKLVGVNIRAKDPVMVKSIVNFSIWSTLLIVAERFIFNIEPTIIGALSISTEIAIFSVASTIEGYTSTLANALGALFLPKVTRIFEEDSENKVEQLQRLMEKVGRIQLFIVGLLLTGLLMMGKEFMVLWMGKEYEKSYYVLLFIISVYLITVTECIADTALVAADCMKWKAICETVTAGINVLVSFLLVPRFGAIGAGIGICIGSISGKLILKNFLFARKLKINILHFFRACFGKLIFLMIVIAGIMGLVQYFVPVNNMLFFLLKATVVSVLYIIIAWLFFLEKDEKVMVKGILK